MISKTCRICRKVKNVHTDYHLCSSERVIDGKLYNAKYRSECKVCRRKGGSAWSTAAKHIMENLNMCRPPIGTPCENCKKTKEMLVFDHDHKTDQFRGWLCYQCNSAIGNLGDTLKGLQQAVRYLKRAEKGKNTGNTHMYNFFKRRKLRHRRLLEGTNGTP
jgi:hypothetical protein